METTFTGFANRAEAGRRLANALVSYRKKPGTIVAGLARGGVLTAAAIAEELDLPLDVLVVRKLGTPHREELAMGAIGPGGVRVLNDDVIRMFCIRDDEIDAVARREQAELERRQRLYRYDLPPLDFRGKTVIVVDDGLATGSTMLAAIGAIRRQDPKRLVLAIPVAPMDTLQRFDLLVDELVYLETPEPFNAVGEWYVDFAQVEDKEIIELLERARERVSVEANPTFSTPIGRAAS